jgi:LysR family transcriptional regulator, transcriptional activator for dmlA
LQAKTRAMVDFMLDAFSDKRRKDRTHSNGADSLW